MSKRLLIDATNPEETRVAVVRGNVLDEFDIEFAARKQIKGNVYLAKVTRVEPSLQAAFVEYGGNRHGFLSFNEIHPDYYQIPIADREKLVEAETAAEEVDRSEEGEIVEEVGGDEIEDEAERRRRPSYRGYKIQEVIKRRQILLVQVVKEERGNKGAALTTYLSLAGRYCVLMPNTNRGGGISRKIANPKDRKRLKSVLDGLDIPEGIGVIVRTAGAERSKPEIKRDYDYLMKQWISIRELTLASTAPKQIYEEASLIKRSIRDLYSKEIDEILVEGDEGYRIAKDFMKTMIPSHAARVKPYKDNDIPILHRYKVESQIDAIHHPVCQLPSGGYIVLNSTEALVAIDVNSGRATRGRSIEETAYKTNIEAAEEVARQLRLRDLAGLIVIDFIDMEVSRNIHAVERKLKEALHTDRARIQVGRISHFGLLEMSRQRLRPSVTETATEICPACGGVGHIRSTEGTALHVLRAIEEEGIRQRGAKIVLHVPTPVALYILNQKRKRLAEIEGRYQFAVSVEADDSLIPPEYRLDRQRTVTEATGEAADLQVTEEPAETIAETKTEEDLPRKRRSRRRRPKAHDDHDAVADMAESRTEDETAGDDSAIGEEISAEAQHESESEEEPKRRRRRGRRGGRRRANRDAESGGVTAGADGAQAELGTESPDGEIAEPAPHEGAVVEVAPEPDVDSSVESVANTGLPDAVAPETAEETPKPKRRRAPRRRRSAAKTDDTGTSTETAEAVAEQTVAPDEPVQSEAPHDTTAEPVLEEVAVSEMPVPAAEPDSVETPEPVMDEAPIPLQAPEPVMEAVAAAAADEPERQTADGDDTETESQSERPKRAGWWQRIVN
ncbi:MAG: Rne/Rng family ribonuclease [Alphaproteobacteria bacterium]